MATTAATTPAAAVPAAAADARKPRWRYQLHHPDTLEVLGTYVASGARPAAMKVASRHKDLGVFYLRKTHSRELHKFEGAMEVLEEPKTVKRGDRFVMYKSKARVKSLGKQPWPEQSEPPADDASAPAAAGDAVAKPARGRRPGPKRTSDGGAGDDENAKPKRAKKVPAVPTAADEPGTV